jgi:hypothetical protein
VNRSGIWPLKAPAWQRAALLEGRALELRRPIGATNSNPQRGKFEAVDMDTAYPAPPVNSGCIRARTLTIAGARRSIYVSSRVRVGDFFWIAGEGRTRAQPPALWVRYVRPERLLSASFASAEAASVVAHGSVLDSYNDVVESMTAGARRAWMRTEHHARAMGPPGFGAGRRELFLARWVVDYGIESLFRNPWTWIYGVEVAPVAVEAARSLARSGALAQVCGASSVVQPDAAAGVHP